MVYNRQKSIADANTEFPSRTQHEIIIPEVPTLSWTVFTTKNYELFVHQVFQYSQDLEDEVYYYHILGLNESATEDDLKNPIVNWLFDPTLTKTSIHRLLLIFA